VAALIDGASISSADPTLEQGSKRRDSGFYFPREIRRFSLDNPGNTA
jgi:hypothetical protein